MKSLEEASRITGIHRRTIQEYEKAGVARKPEHRTKQGYLRYDEDSILRLMQIRFYKELGYESGEIRDILAAPGYDREKAITAQLTAMERQKQRLEDLIAIGNAVQEGKLSPDLLLQYLPEPLEAPFDVMISAFAAGLRAGQGQEVPDSDLTEEEWGACFTEAAKIMELVAWGYSVDSEPVQQRVEQMRELLAPIVPPSIQAFSQLGELLVSDPEFRQHIEETFPEGSAEVLHRAVQVYCEAHCHDPVDPMARDTLLRIEQLRLAGTEPEAGEVQTEIGKLARYLELLGDSQGKLLQDLGEFLQRQVMEDWAAEDRDSTDFQAQAIAHYCRTVRPDA